MASTVLIKRFSCPYNLCFFLFTQARAVRFLCMYKALNSYEMGTYKFHYLYVDAFSQNIFCKWGIRTYIVQKYISNGLNNICLNVMRYIFAFSVQVNFKIYNFCFKMIFFYSVVKMGCYRQVKI